MRNRRNLTLSTASVVVLTLSAFAGLITPPRLRATAQASVGTAEDRPRFDVASVKPSAISKEGGEDGGEGSSRSEIQYSPDSLTMRNVTLRECVQWAYRVEAYQITVPSPLDAKRYDILAKSADPVPVSDLRLMLQQLLAERFQLVLHRDTKTIRVFALTVAKGGPKLPPAKADGDDGVPLNHAVESLPRVDNGSFVFQETSMGEFAAKLSLLYGVDRPVVDRTGIQGIYDITLKGAARQPPPGSMPGHAQSVSASDPSAPVSIFTAVQEQLGLKLEAQTGPADVLVVDHVAEPTPN